MSHGKNHVSLYLMQRLLLERIFRYRGGNAFIRDWPLRDHTRRARPYDYSLFFVTSGSFRAA